jgi:hypothetical protein
VPPRFERESASVPDSTTSLGRYCQRRIQPPGCWGVETYLGPFLPLTGFFQQASLGILKDEEKGAAVSVESGANRWWENYLVRYLMPSIAGVAIVSWICSHGGDGLRSILMLPKSGQPLDATSLTLIFLYGNLFCYVASYPVLVFHVTRVIDFVDGKWTIRFSSDGYVSSAILTIVALAAFHLSSTELRFWVAFFLVGLLLAIQIRRLCLALRPRIDVQGLSGTVSPAFGFTYALARRRGVHDETEKKRPSKNASAAIHASFELDSEEEIETSRRIDWRPEFMATYRHMREHGNSAFIFVFELTLACLVVCVITKTGQSPAQQLGAIGTLLALWAAPSVLVHLLGQHLERRFAKYDERLSDGPIEKQASVNRELETRPAAAPSLGDVKK